MVFIYALIDPTTCKIRYIGKTINLKQRLSNQLNENSNTHRCNWIKGLKLKGLKPIQCILQTLNDADDWVSCEIKWIAIAKKYGWDLVNSTDGGDGVLNISGESKERMCKTWIGRKHRPESIEKMRLANTGKVRSENAKNIVSEKMKGRKIEWSDKLVLANRKFSDEDLKNATEDLKTMKVIDVAKKYGVHRTTVTKIKNGEYKTFKQKVKNYVKPRRFHGKE